MGIFAFGLAFDAWFVGEYMILKSSSMHGETYMLNSEADLDHTNASVSWSSK